MKIKKNILVIILVLIIFLGGSLILANHTSYRHKSTDSVTSSNGLKISIRGKEDSKYMGHAKSKNKLTTINMSIENQGSLNIPVGAIDFEVRLSNKKTISPDSGYDGFYTEMGKNSKDLESLYFKVPKSQYIEKLYYHTDRNNRVELDVN